MTERERLVELIEKGATNYACCTNYDGNAFDYIADHLLANGVIVPPCKVGDTLYYIVDNEVFEVSVLSFEVDEKVTNIVSQYYDWYDVDCLGKTVFLTKEAALQALKERERE